MPLELLRQLAEQQLPLTVTDTGDIDKLRVLRAAGHVAALISPLEQDQPFARVMAITAEGRRALLSDASA